MSTLRLSVQSPAAGDAVLPLVHRGDALAIGADPACDLRLPGPGAPLRLAEIARETGAPGGAERWVLTALDATASVLLNGEPQGVGVAAALSDADEIRVLGYEITVRLLTPSTLDGSSPGLSGEQLSERLALGPAQQPAGAPPRAGPAGPLPYHPEVLVVINGPQRGRATPPLDVGRRLLVGRSRACEVTLTDPRVSRRHARLGRDRRGLWIRSVGGVGGVRVNGRWAPGRRRLLRGDLVDIGGTRLEVRHGGRGAYEGIVGPAGAPQSSAGRLGGRLARIGLGPVMAELDRWEVLDPVGLGLGLAGIVLGLVGLLRGLAIL